MNTPGPTSNTFISQRLKLHYVDWGNPGAPLLILQHGGRDHCRSWDWVAAELAQDWHVIAPDLRGHGDSAWAADGDYDMDSFVYDFAQLVHSLGEQQVTIMAHSLGGMITTRFVGLYPQKVRRFVNIEGLGPSPQLLRKRDEQGFANRFREWIDAKRKAAGRAPRRYPTIEAAYQRMKEENGFLTDAQARHLTVHGTIRNEDGTFSWKFDPYLHVWPFGDHAEREIASLWADISCPMLLLYGSDSFMTNPESDGRAAHLPTAQVVEFADAGHWLHHDQFDRFLREVRAFL
ncbi:alpha/beta fold hydrolase [Parablastomonas sp. CN1-191]|uniref:alpha/beta fold hydrolase n=1 Tax=Parablastomonas sp. CN1-191 TaxID=3400908 RepID=UPI003BF8DB98